MLRILKTQQRFCLFVLLMIPCMPIAGWAVGNKNASAEWWSNNVDQVKLWKENFLGVISLTNLVQHLTRKNVNQTDDDHTTVLHQAARYGNLEIVQYLVETLGANVNASNYSSWTPLHEAVGEGHTDTVKYLLSRGANIHAADFDDGEMPLHLAAENGHLNIVKSLLDHEGANIEARTQEGTTALHRAAYSGQFEVVEYLLAKGANIHATTKLGNTPLHRAACNGQLEIVKYLLAKGADINATSQDGCLTPLHMAAYYGRREAIPTNEAGVTHLYWVEHEAQIHVVEYLLAHGAEVNAITDDGATALDLAIRRGYAAVARCIEDHIAQQAPYPHSDIIVNSNLAFPSPLPTPDLRPDSIKTVQNFGIGQLLESGMPREASQAVGIPSATPQPSPRPEISNAQMYLDTLLLEDALEQVPWYSDLISGWHTFEALAFALELMALKNMRSGYL